MIPGVTPTNSLPSGQTWLVTGGAGFIGSHIVQWVLANGGRVRVLDDFSTGRMENLQEASFGQADRLEVVEGDLRDPAACKAAVHGATVILHQAALGSVPRSIGNPLATHETNVTGFLNILLAARDAGTRRVVYASSSSVYGDHPGLPKIEDRIGRQLSPYAVSKYADELYAHAFGLAYGMDLIGLRYFNVFGPRQDPAGPYAAVVPLWTKALLSGSDVFINGDGETSRDFCFVDNVVQANILAATTPNEAARGRVFNVAVGERTTLRQLFEMLRTAASRHRPSAAMVKPAFRNFRGGDVRHSLADVSSAVALLGYDPAVTVAAGVARTVDWYASRLTRA